MLFRGETHRCCSISRNNSKCLAWKTGTSTLKSYLRNEMCVLFFVSFHAKCWPLWKQNTFSTPRNIHTDISMWCSSLFLNILPHFNWKEEKKKKTGTKLAVIKRISPPLFFFIFPLITLSSSFNRTFACQFQRIAVQCAAFCWQITEYVIDWMKFSWFSYFKEIENSTNNCTFFMRNDRHVWHVAKRNRTTSNS